MFASMTPFKSLTTRFKISTQSPGESALLTPGILQLSFTEYSACSWKVTATDRHWYPLELCSWFWLGGDEGKALFLRQRMVKGVYLISTIVAITVVWPVFVQELACVWLDLRACKAKEIFQDFTNYLSHGQMLDWVKTRGEFLLRS